ncbi:type IV pilus secretin PilQ [Marinospirillum insulare]|uniref:Pilus assembly protein PilQ n=1 Tax=Marinospirillum insulare TaxID=217169 RepID=A0ABQ5ZYE8_9GAMM|nr:type IV pilus secretin PilQ [Marinospirillum insulare]GLR63691.1 pilus assembly protein PilQ [Marinospirillum insulare]
MTINLHSKAWPLVFLCIVSLLLPLTALANKAQITGIDFQRTNQGNARVLLDFSSQPLLPEAEELPKGLKLKFPTTDINYDLINLYDTNDFSTQVNQLELFQTGNRAELIINIEGEYNYLFNTRDKQLQIEITANSLSQDAARSPGSSAFRYTGDLVSLSYHDIPVRELLAELAAFLDLNLVAGENVVGNITLQLEDIPSDQALDIVLISQGLASRQQGKILLVAPATDLIQLEEQQQKAKLSATNVSPLEDAFIKIRYADATALQAFILGDQEADNTPTNNLAAGLLGSLPMPSLEQEQNTRQSTRRFLSERGHLLVDDRTNTLYVRDTAEQVNRIQDLVKTLDVPVDQVMIEARIVVARTGVGEELGVSWGVRSSPTAGLGQFNTRRETERGALINDNLLESNRGTSIDFSPETGANFGFVSNKLLLDLELAALESENRSEIISQPKVITSNRNKAVIRSGEEIPYTSVDGDGERTTEFRQAELRLEVTPQIVGDGRIFLNLQVNNDSKGEETKNSGPTINTNAVETQVLVNNGETIVIGGIFTSQKLEGESKVPFLGDIPLIGWLFRSSYSSQEKVELLVFITPRMIDDALARN